MDFDVPAGHRVKIKENEKIEKYLELAREQKKVLNMVTVIPTVFGALGTFSKGLGRRLEI